MTESHRERKTRNLFIFSSIVTFNGTLKLLKSIKMKVVNCRNNNKGIVEFRIHFNNWSESTNCDSIGHIFSCNMQYNVWKTKEI